MKIRTETGIAIAAIALTVFSFFASPLWNQRFRDEKKLEYGVQKIPLSPRALDAKTWGGIFIQTEDGRRLDGAALWSILIRNVGLVPITKSDLDGADCDSL